MQPRGAKLTEQIVIGTPGTMLDWAQKFKHFDMKKIKVRCAGYTIILSLRRDFDIYS